MSDKIIDFLDFYKGKEIEDILSHPAQILSDLKEVESELQSSGFTKDDEIYHLLSRIRGALSGHIDALKDQIETTKSDMVRSKNSNTACLAYLSSSDKGSKK